MSKKDRFLDWFLLRGTVDAVEDVTPRMRRIRITGEQLRDLDWKPGQHVRVRVGDLSIRGLRDVLRTYSVWDYDSRGRLDLCVLDHPEPGPGVRWAQSVHAGQHVAFTRPEGRLVLQDGAPYHLFVGDETAAVAFGPMLRALPAAVPVFGVLEASTPEDRVPLVRSTDLTWDGTLPALDLPAEPGIAYIAGEARACQAARQHLVRDRGWPRKATIVKPFWAPGKRGLD